MKIYPGDITDSQRQVIKNIVDNERKRKHKMWEIVNAILYIIKTGCQWRMLPKDYAPWQMVFYYFRKCKRDDLIEEVHDNLVCQIHLKKGKKVNTELSRYLLMEYMAGN